MYVNYYETLQINHEFLGCNRKRRKRHIVSHGIKTTRASNLEMSTEQKAINVKLRRVGLMAFRTLNRDESKNIKVN